MRRGVAHAAFTAALAAVLVGAALSGCAASAPAPRATPDAGERAAVQRTSDAFNAPADDPLAWVQLWTMNQFPAQLQDCVAAQSHGQLEVQVALPLLRALSYRITGSSSHPDEAEASVIIEHCAGATPLDDRVLRVPPAQWDVLYSYELTTLKPCLVAHGQTVGRVPNRRTFSRMLSLQQPWSPYDEVRVATRADWYRLADACPALPPAIALTPPPALLPLGGSARLGNDPGNG